MTRGVPSSQWRRSSSDGSHSTVYFELPPGKTTCYEDSGGIAEMVKLFPATIADRLEVLSLAENINFLPESDQP